MIFNNSVRYGLYIRNIILNHKKDNLTFYLNQTTLAPVAAREAFGGICALKN